MSSETKGLSVKLIHAEDERVIELEVIHNGKVVRGHCDMMEPEDATFDRGFKWIPDAIQEAYRLGKEDASKEILENFTSQLDAGKRFVGFSMSSDPSKWFPEGRG